MDLSKCNIQQLKSCLHDLRAKVSGNKAHLVSRLQTYDPEVVKGLLEKYAGSRVHDTSAADLDITTYSENGEDAVASLKGDVAILKDTVQQLVQKLQILFTDPKPNEVLSLNSDVQRNAALPIQVEEPVNFCDNTAQTSQPVVTAQEIIANGAINSEPSGSIHVSSPEVNMVQARMIPTNNCQIGEAQPIAINLFPHAQGGNHGLHQVNSSAYSGPSAYGGQGSNIEPLRHDLVGALSGHSDVRDLVRIMPEFCPGTGLSSVMFIDRINQLSRAYGWSDQMILYAVYDKLKGPARQWINAMPIFSRWSDFIQAFLADFPCDVNAAELNIKMMRTRMTRNDSYLEYFYKMLALGRSGGMQDSAIITYIINGIYDDTMKKILSAMHFARCFDLLRTLTNFQNDRRPHMPHVPNQLHTTPTQRNANQNQSEQNKQVKFTTGGLTCYRCRERGHIARNCKKPRDAINNINHASEAIDINEATVNNIKQKQKNLEPLVKIRISSATPVICNALIDSGSSKTLVKRTIADKCKLPKITCEEKLIGFAGGEVVCTEKIMTELHFDDGTYMAELLIVDDSKLTYDVLIGIDVLHQATVIINKGVCRIMPVTVANLDINEDVPQQVMEYLKNVMNEFSHCFGEKLSELGRSKTFKVNIALTSSKPVVRKPYPIPIPKQKTVEEIIDQLLEMGIIRQSQSSYASPIVLANKQNGETRLCVDYRELNAITHKQPWQMPTVDGVLATLANQKYFTTLDMMSGYYQLEVEESCRQYTAFVTHNGHFEFCRMPFGLRNAPCAFQRLMSHLIAPLGKSVTTYVDEIIIATETAESNIDVLKELLKLVEGEGLTLRSSKCSFFKNSVSFLGHVVDSHGIRPGIAKTIAIRSYPAPRNQHEVRMFLGLASFFRKFIQNFAVIARPINNLLKKEVTFKWTDECDEAFQKLKTVLTESPVLGVYDVRKAHQLHTDASSIGIAAVLLQEEENLLKPIAYFSRACSAAESKYHAYELEVLAVVAACERYRTYLLGKHFKIVTDCQAIASAKLNKPMVPRMARWLLKLMEYDYIIVHRAGDSMRHVDALSRTISATDATTTIECAPIMEITIEDWVSTLQKQDPKIKATIEILSGKIQSDQKRKLASEYCVQQHRLFKKTETNKLLLVVPKGMRWRILKLCHDDTGHPGLDGTLKRITEHFWFPRIRNFAKGYLKSCVDCTYYRDPKKKEAELYGMEIPKVPFQVLHMDHLGPFVKSRRGNEYVLVIVDALTRYTIVIPVKSTTTKPVITALNQLTLYFGLPQRLVTDRGTAFTSTAFADFCKLNNILHTKVAVRTPRANGIAERVNQSIISYLKPASNDQRCWDDEVRMLQWSLNTKINSTTKMAPIDLVYDFPLRDLTGNKLLTALHDDVCFEMNTRRTEAIKNIELAREKWKKRFDAKHKTPTKYEVGDLVLIQAPPPNTGHSKKLEPSYKGPYEVKKVLRFDRYIVGDMDGMQRSQRRYSSVVAVDKMKPWCSLFPDIDTEFDDEDAAVNSN